MKKVTSLAVLAVLALVLGACGADDAAGQLPMNDGPGDSPGAAGACLVTEPDCDDTGALPGAEPLPPPSDNDAAGGDDLLASGVITVSEALVGDYGGVVVVQGFLFDDGSGPRLCDALAESFPPQCGGEGLAVTGHEEFVDVPLLSEQGVTWADQIVTLRGEISGGLLVVDPALGG